MLPAPARRMVFKRFQRWSTPLRVLNLYAAAGITSFGWALSRLLHFHCERYAPLWFFGTLLIYNLDRLKTDPADAWNTPCRTRFVERYRRQIRALCCFSGGCILAIPLILKDGLLLALVILAAITSLSYSLPLFGTRLKAIALCKTPFVPVVVTGALLLPAILQQPRLVSDWHLAGFAAWTFSLLLFNVFLCDQRDVAGDAAHGIRSLPILLGPVSSRRFLLAILLVVLLLSAHLAHSTKASPGAILFPAIYLAWLLYLSCFPRSEAFYEWCVDGLLFIPAVGYLVSAIG